MRQRSPQEKKRLSYKKDCRNIFGENAKASRKNLPRKKRHERRAYRRRANLPLIHADIAADPEAEVMIEPRMGSGWGRRGGIKYADLPLGAFVIGRLLRRVHKSISQIEATKAKIEQIEHKANLLSRRSLHVVFVDYYPFPPALD